MFGDDDVAKPRPRFVPLPLDRLGVEELQAYVGELQAETAKAEAEIARKRDVRSAADHFFKRSSSQTE